MNKENMGIYTVNYYSATKRWNSITYSNMVLEAIILDETIQQQEDNMTWYHLYVQTNWKWSKRIKIWLSETGERQHIEIEEEMVNKHIIVRRNKILGSKDQLSEYSSNDGVWMAITWKWWISKVTDMIKPWFDHYMAYTWTKTQTSYPTCMQTYQVLMGI